MKNINTYGLKKAPNEYPQHMFLWRNKKTFQQGASVLMSTHNKILWWNKKKYQQCLVGKSILSGATLTFFITYLGHARLFTIRIPNFERMCLKTFWMRGKQFRPWSDAAFAASDLGLHCLLRPFFLNTYYGKYSMVKTCYNFVRLVSVECMDFMCIQSACGIDSWCLWTVKDVFFMPENTWM